MTYYNIMQSESQRGAAFHVPREQTDVYSMQPDPGM